VLRFAEPGWTLHPPRRWQPEAMTAVEDHFALPDPEPAVISAVMGAGKSLLLSELLATVQLGDHEHVVVSTSTQDLVASLAETIRGRVRGMRSVGEWYTRRKHIGQITVACVPSLYTLAQELRERGASTALWVADECHRSECGSVLEAEPILDPMHSLGLTATPFRSDHMESVSLFKEVIYRYGVADALKDRVVVPWRIKHWGGTVSDLDAVCLEMIREQDGPGLVNACDIEDAEAFAQYLTENGVPAEAIHSTMPVELRAARLLALEKEDIRCVVHVNMLSEGANFPFLRWMCLRREVGARVRFIQEIGRLLRSHPGKDEAVYLDPHDLFGTFKLSYKEALGEPPPRPESRMVMRDPDGAARGISDPDPALSLAWIESTVRALTVVCDAMGMMGRYRRIIPKEDRVRPSTRMQWIALDAACRAVERLAPEGWKRCLRAIRRKPEGIRFGFAADLLSALNGIRRVYSWPDIDDRGEIRETGPDDHTAAP